VTHGLVDRGDLVHELEHLSDRSADPRPDVVHPSLDALRSPEIAEMSDRVRDIGHVSVRIERADDVR
jgi:hypothetical protein